MGEKVELTFDPESMLRIGEGLDRHLDSTDRLLIKHFKLYSEETGEGEYSIELNKRHWRIVVRALGDYLNVITPSVLGMDHDSYSPGPRKTSGQETVENMYKNDSKIIKGVLDRVNEALA